MSIVHQKDKRSGITYVYESQARWDKEKKQSRSIRRLIGRLDDQTGEVLQTDGRGRKGQELGTTAIPVKENRQEKRASVLTHIEDRRFCGATYLFDCIGEETGITADLRACFPDTYKMILSVAYYLILEDHNPLSRFGKWQRFHTHPYGEDIPSQRSSELFAGIREEQKMKFFRLQGVRRDREEYWAYDSTSLSSHSECLSQVRYGKNKDNEPLPQINLLLLFGEKSYLPFYYRKLAGNIPDVKTLQVLIRDLDILGYSKVKLVTDRGFYSTGNVNSLYKEHIKFLMAARTSLTFVKQVIEREGSRMRNWDHYCDKYDLYTYSETIAWNYSQKRPYKGDTVEEPRRMYLHLYYNPEKAVEDEREFNRHLLCLKDELMTGKRVASHQSEYEKYFTIKETPVRGRQVLPRQEILDEAKKRYGYFVLLSNEVKEATIALELYRNRDVVEKAFDNIKERLNGKRLLVSSNAALEGKLFVEFIALIYLSYIKKHMQDKNLFKKYTLQGLLDELDVIECFITPGKDPFIGEVLQKQQQIYLDMGVKNPVTAASLCV